MAPGVVVEGERRERGVAGHNSDALHSEKQQHRPDQVQSEGARDERAQGRPRGDGFGCEGNRKVTDEHERSILCIALPGEAHARRLRHRQGAGGTVVLPSATRERRWLVPVVIAVVALLAAGAAVWFFLMRPKPEQSAATPAPKPAAAAAAPHRARFSPCARWRERTRLFRR